jgi:hypothetical protein
VCSVHQYLLLRMIRRRTKKYEPSELSGPISSPPTGGSSGIPPSPSRSVGRASIALAVADASHDTTSLIVVAVVVGIVSSILYLPGCIGVWVCRVGYYS